jgi:hypothetical protein
MNHTGLHYNLGSPGNAVRNEGLRSFGLARVFHREIIGGRHSAGKIIRSATPDAGISGRHRSCGQTRCPARTML